MKRRAPTPVLPPSHMSVRLSAATLARVDALAPRYTEALAVAYPVGF